MTQSMVNENFGGESTYGNVVYLKEPSLGGGSCGFILVLDLFDGMGWESCRVAQSRWISILCKESQELIMIC